MRIVVGTANQANAAPLGDLLAIRTPTPGQTFVRDTILGRLVIGGETVASGDVANTTTRILEVPNGTGSTYGLALAHDSDSEKYLLFSLAYAPCSGIAAMTADGFHVLGHSPPGQLLKLVNAFIGTGKHAGASVVFFGNTADAGVVRNVDAGVLNKCRENGIIAMPFYLHSGGHRAVDALVTSKGLGLNIISSRQRRIEILDWPRLKQLAEDSSRAREQQEIEKRRVAEEHKNRITRENLARQVAQNARVAKALESVRQRQAKEEEDRKIRQQEFQQRTAALAAERQRLAQRQREQNAQRALLQAQNAHPRDGTTRASTLLKQTVSDRLKKGGNRP